MRTLRAWARQRRLWLALALLIICLLSAGAAWAADPKTKMIGTPSIG